MQGNKKDISKEFRFRFEQPAKRGGFKKDQGDNRQDGGKGRYPPRNRDNRGYGGRGRNNYNGQKRNNQPKKVCYMLPLKKIILYKDY